MEQKLTFTAYLKDEYSKSFDKLADKTEKGANDMEKDLHGMTKAVRGVTASIDVLGKKLEALNRLKRTKVHVDKTEIEKAHKEIELLKKELEALKNSGMPTSSGGAPRGGGGWLGGMGGGFAIAGTALAAGALLRGVANSSIDATAKYQKFEAVLATSFGNTGQAKAAMETIENFAATTPYAVDELAEAYVRLRNRGFNPSIEVLTKIGDLAASQGKDFMQVTEALLDAPQKQFIRLQEALGVDVQRVKGGKLRFVGLGQDKIIDDNPEEIKKLVLEFGNLKGIMGSMSSIAKTTGGGISNLKDNIDLTYKALGDRFKPEINASISGLSKLVLTIKGWVEIPVSQRLQEETNKLQSLRVQLGEANVTEARRKEILEEIKKIQPDIIDGTKSEEEQLRTLNGTLDNYLKKRREQISMQMVKEKYAENLIGYERARSWQQEIMAKEDNAIAEAAGRGFKTDGLTRDQQLAGARAFLEKLPEANRLANLGGENAVGMTLRQLRQADVDRKMAFNLLQKNFKGKMEADRAQLELDTLFGAFSPSGMGNPGGQGGSGAGSGTAIGTGKGGSTTPTSISGGAKVTTLNISIQNLVNGGFTIQTTTMKESPQQIKDVVLDALMTAVNDVNLIASN